MKKFISVDLGSTTMGVAKSDILGIAYPFEEFRFDRGNYRAARERLYEICKSTGIYDVVVGYPYQLDRQAGDRCDSVDRFINDLINAYPEVKVDRCDESFTTIEAHERLREAGHSEKEIKIVIDMYSAVVILEDFLNSYIESRKPYKGDDNL